MVKQFNSELSKQRKEREEGEQRGINQTEISINKKLLNELNFETLDDKIKKLRGSPALIL